MIDLLNVTLVGLAIIILMPSLILSIEIVAALFPARKSATFKENGKRPSIAILIPAHDEAAVISATLQAVMPQLQKGDRIIVVADNCSDDTGEIALQLGAEVIERTDLENRGKGFALDFGVRHLESKPPDVVIVIDADCQTGERVLEALGFLAISKNRPIQALDLMRPQENAPAALKVGALAWSIKNHVRPLGLRRLGLPCNLMGTGMAFPWAIIKNTNLASGNIVEDMKLGLDLAEKGIAPVFCPEVKVTSHFPASAGAAREQRTRWEHGHLTTVFADVPRRLFRGLSSGNVGLFALALDAAVPPLTFYAITLVMLICLSGAAWGLGASSAPFVISIWAFGLFFGAMLLAWAKFGRNLLPLSLVGTVFTYILSKLPIYARFFTKRQTKWVRTDRD